MRFSEKGSVVWSCHPRVERIAIIVYSINVRLVFIRIFDLENECINEQRNQRSEKE